MLQLRKTVATIRECHIRRKFRQALETWPRDAWCREREARHRDTDTMQDFLPHASEILKANAETLKALADRLIENGHRVLDQVQSELALPREEWIITRDEIESICRRH